MNHISNKKSVIYVKKEFITDIDNSSEVIFIKYCRVRDHCHYNGKNSGATHNICSLKYIAPKEIPGVFHNDFTYDYHFIIKELAEKFEGQFEWLGEKRENSFFFFSFLVLIEKELDNRREATYKIKFIDSFRFFSSSLSNLNDNLSNGIRNIKCGDYKPDLKYILTEEDEL